MAPPSLPSSSAVTGLLKQRVISTDAECDEFYANSVLVISEFGGNNYNAPLFAGEALEDTYKFMADAISICFVSAMMGLQWHRARYHGSWGDLNSLIARSSFSGLDKLSEYLLSFTFGR
uniref:Uncharacterized protein n=1 Tax=Oryza barthii TaxID=65489 RepID=A0A0D3HA27_9ORYZ